MALSIKQVSDREVVADKRNRHRKEESYGWAWLYKAGAKFELARKTADMWLTDQAWTGCNKKGKKDESSQATSKKGDNDGRKK